MNLGKSIALLAFMVSIQGYAVQNVGGGSAIVCRDSSNEIIRAELLDIFEGQKRFGMTIPTYTTNNPDQQVRTALTKLSSKPGLASYVVKIYSDVYAHRVFLPGDIALQTSNDLGTDYTVSIIDGCHLEQIGYYESDGTLRIATNVYNHLSSTAQAGFWLHETLYRLTRTLAGASDSAEARKLVAELLATSVTSQQVTADVAGAFKESDTQIFVPLHPVAGAKFSVLLDTVEGYTNVITVVRTDGSKSEIRIWASPSEKNEFDGDDVQDIYVTIDEEALPEKTSNIVNNFKISYNNQVIHQTDSKYTYLRKWTNLLPYAVHVGWQK